MHRQAAPVAQINDFNILTCKSIEGSLTGSHVITGPTTIEAVERADPRSQTQIQAQTITITPVKDNPRLAERVEAVGNPVRFSGTRPTADGKAVRTFKGTGSKAVYFKQEGRVVFDGPVTYYAQQPTDDGKGIQTLEGTATSAIFNEKTGLLIARDVKGTFMHPAFERPSHFAGDSLTIDLGKRPYAYKLENDDITHGSVQFTPKPSEKKPEKKPEKKSG